MVRHSSFLLQPSCNSDESSIVLVPLVQAGYRVLATHLVGILFKVSYLVALSILVCFEELANVFVSYTAAALNRSSYGQHQMELITSNDLQMSRTRL